MTPSLSCCFCLLSEENQVASRGGFAVHPPVRLATRWHRSTSSPQAWSLRVVAAAGRRNVTKGRTSSQSNFDNMFQVFTHDFKSFLIAFIRRLKYTKKHYFLFYIMLEMKLSNTNLTVSWLQRWWEKEGFLCGIICKIDLLNPNMTLCTFILKLKVNRLTDHYTIRFCFFVKQMNPPSP